MQVNFDHYIRNFRIFYQQVVKGHRREDELCTAFKALLDEEVRRGRKGGDRRARIDEQPTSNVHFLNKFNEERKNKKNKVHIDILNCTPKLNNAIVFAYLLYLL